MRVYTLGAGTPTPTPSRFGSAHVVAVGGRHLLFDCGPAATHKLVKAGLRPTQIDQLYFTHHHFDHDADYPCFLLCRWDQGAGLVDELEVFGPSPTRLITERLIGEEGAFVFDWKARVNNPASQILHVKRGGTLPRLPPAPSITEIESGYVHSAPEFQVTSARAEHAQPWLDSLAYRVDSESGSVVITGDTGPCDSVVNLARGADAMLCMCWDHQGSMHADEVRGTAGTIDAAEMAQKAEVKRLVLVHSGPSFAAPGSHEKAVADIAKIYDGEIIWAEELSSLDIGTRSHAGRSKIAAPASSSAPPASTVPVVLASQPKVRTTPDAR